MANPVLHALESARSDLMVGLDYFYHIIGGDRISVFSVGLTQRIRQKISSHRNTMWCHVPARDTGYLKSRGVK